MLVAAAAAPRVVGARRGFAIRAGDTKLGQLGAAMVRLALGDADARLVALGGEGDEQDEAFRGAGEAVAAEDNFPDGDVENGAQRGPGG
jgi:hypothetical protein